MKVVKITVYTVIALLSALVLGTSGLLWLLNQVGRY